MDLLVWECFTYSLSPKILFYFRSNSLNYILVKSCVLKHSHCRFIIYLNRHVTLRHLSLIDIWKQVRTQKLFLTLIYACFAVRSARWPTHYLDILGVIGLCVCMCVCVAAWIEVCVASEYPCFLWAEIKEIETTKCVVNLFLSFIHHRPSSFLILWPDLPFWNHHICKSNS